MSSFVRMDFAYSPDDLTTSQSLGSILIIYIIKNNLFLSQVFEYKPHFYSQIYRIQILSEFFDAQGIFENLNLICYLSLKHVACCTSLRYINYIIFKINIHTGYKHF